MKKQLKPWQTLNRGRISKTIGDIGAYPTHMKQVSRRHARGGVVSGGGVSPK